MTFDELNSLDPKNIGAWPLPVRMVIIALVCVAVAYGLWIKDIQPQLQEIESIKKEEISLKKTFETKQRKAADLEALREQLAEMQQSFGDMVRQLPDKTEMRGLIVDISQVGLSSGLTFELFRPDQEKSVEFYLEVPISIKVIGEYHQFGEFVSGVATLPRIVTTHDIDIQSVSSTLSKGSLIMTAKVKTYRAIDEEEDEE